MSKITKVIKVTPGGDVTIEDMGVTNTTNFCSKLTKVIGNGCFLVEPVPVSNELTPAFPEGFDIVVDEAGWLRDNPEINILGSYLYGYQVHGSAVAGNLVIVAVKETRDGDTWVGLTPEQEKTMMAWITENMLSATIAVSMKSTMNGR